MKYTEINFEYRLQKIEDTIAQDKQNIETYQEAIEEFSKLIAQEPFNYLVYRHRGHRYLSTSKFHQAAADLSLACQINPYYWKSWYYLGMINYYLGDYTQAIYYYQQSLHFICKDQVYICAITNWLYICKCHLGLKDDPATQELLKPYVKTGMEGVQVYPNLLLLHKGEVSTDEILALRESGDLSDVSYISIGFGLALYYYFNGEKDQSRKLCFEILEEGKSWSALAYIACKMDLGRLF